MRIACDANVLVRAILHPTGLAREILERSTRSPHVLVLSPHILAEVHRVLHYPHIQKRFAIPDKEIDDAVRMLAAVSDVVLKPAIIPVVPTDPEDDAIVATAVDGGADVLCTLDRHFRHRDVLAFCARHSIRVLSDVELLSALRRAA